MKKIIFVFWILLITGIVLRFFLISGGISLVFFSCAALALLYFFFGLFIFTGRDVSFRKKFSIKSEIETDQILFSIVIGVLFSISFFGIQSRMRVHAGADIILLMCLFSILMFVFVVLCISKASFILIIRKRLIHYVFIFVVCTTLYLIPNRILVAIKFPNQPEIQKVYMEFLNNPDDKHIKEKLDVLLNEHYQN